MKVWNSNSIWDKNKNEIFRTFFFLFDWRCVFEWKWKQNAHIDTCDGRNIIKSVFRSGELLKIACWFNVDITIIWKFNESNTDDK